MEKSLFLNILDLILNSLIYICSLHNNMERIRVSTLSAHTHTHIHAAYVKLFIVSSHHSCESSGLVMVYIVCIDPDCGITPLLPHFHSDF